MQKVKRKRIDANRKSFWGAGGLGGWGIRAYWPAYVSESGYRIQQESSSKDALHGLLQQPTGLSNWLNSIPLFLNLDHPQNTECWFHVYRVALVEAVDWHLGLIYFDFDPFFARKLPRSSPTFFSLLPPPDSTREVTFSFLSAAPQPTSLRQRTLRVRHLFEARDLSGRLAPVSTTHDQYPNRLIEEYMTRAFPSRPSATILPSFL